MKTHFIQLLSGSVKPLLKLKGFSKKGLSFYRRLADLIFIINFQNSQGNTSAQTKFYVNCGIYSMRIDEVIGKAPCREPKEYECHFRKRISALVNAAEDVYLVDAHTDLQVMGSGLLADLERVVGVFDDIHSTADLVELMIEENGLNNYLELFEFLLLTGNLNGLRLHVQTLQQTFGKERRWSIFEEQMLNVLKVHNTGESLNDILK